jgi:hypothetical protein
LFVVPLFSFIQVLFVLMVWFFWRCLSCLLCLIHSGFVCFGGLVVLALFFVVESCLSQASVRGYEGLDFDALSDLTPSLRSEVALHMRDTVFKHFGLAHIVDKNFLTAMVLRLKREANNPGCCWCCFLTSISKHRDARRVLSYFVFCLFVRSTHILSLCLLQASF